MTLVERINKDCLEVIDLHKEYEGKPLLNGVGFKVESGEILCLLGSSGSGKSTILRIIAGIEKSESGSVMWNNKDMNEISVFQRNFGLMFQDYALFPHLSVAQNVAFGLKMQRVTKTEMDSRVREALDRVNMSGFSERRVTDLSGGEQQRIALARALAPRPGLLMLDEPLAALDHSLRLELQLELRSLLHRSGIPAIYVTHDQEEAIAVSDRLALLNAGKIVQCDRTERVFRYPINRWVATFLGMTNFLEGIVLSVDPFEVQTKCGMFAPFISDLPINYNSGDQVTLLVKPTGIQLGTGSNSPNQFDGIVVEVNFRGDHYLVKVQVCPGCIMEFSAAMSLNPGEVTHIRLEPEDIIVLLD